MSDISKCNGADCDVREQCYRFNAPANPNRQSYISPEKRGKDCKFFWDNRGYAHSKSQLKRLDAQLSPEEDI